MAEPLTAEQHDAIVRRNHYTADPDACGTCRRLIGEGRSPEHDGCRKRSVLIRPLDAPDYEELVDLDEAARVALPPRFHTPAWEGNATPNAWLCAVCWGDGWVTRWPCQTAAGQGGLVFVPEHHAEGSRRDVDTLLAEVKRLEGEQ